SVPVTELLQEYHTFVNQIDLLQEDWKEKTDQLSSDVREARRFLNACGRYKGHLNDSPNIWHAVELAEGTLIHAVAERIAAYRFAESAEHMEGFAREIGGFVSIAGAAGT